MTASRILVCYKSFSHFTALHHKIRRDFVTVSKTQFRASIRFSDNDKNVQCFSGKCNQLRSEK